MTVSSGIFPRSIRCLSPSAPGRVRRSRRPGCAPKRGSPTGTAAKPRETCRPHDLELLGWPRPGPTRRQGAVLHAFAARDLPDAVERFALEWDDLPTLIPGRPEYRLLIGVGQVVAFYAIEAQLAPEGAVELVSVTIDASGLTE
jgi:hypothetical protein